MECEFDYILILVDNPKRRKEAVNALIQDGLDVCKIVEPVLFDIPDTRFIPNLSNFCESVKPRRNIVLGLSYSLYGLDVSTLPGGYRFVVAWT